VPVLRQDGAALVIAAIAGLQPGSQEERPDYELRISAIEDAPEAAAYLTASSVAELLDIVLAVTAVLGA
jgi:hypothetical protein